MLTIIGDEPGLTNQISDGNHTFGELYDHRITLFIALCRQFDGLKNQPWRMPPKDGWFLMGIGRKAGDQISYHLPESRWEETYFCDTIAPEDYEFDGHTSQDVINRLKKL